MHNTGQVTTVLNSSEIEGMLLESSVAISNTSTVAFEPKNAGYMDSTSPVLDVTVSKETGVFSPNQNVDILVDAIPRLPSINDAFWEQFLAASRLTGDTDEIHPSSQESSVAKESEVVSWEVNGWNKVQQMNHLTEQLGLLTSKGGDMLPNVYISFSLLKGFVYCTAGQTKLLLHRRMQDIILMFDKLPLIFCHVY